MEIKELTLLERLKLSHRYSKSEKHRKDLLKRILELENKNQISINV